MVLVFDTDTDDSLILQKKRYVRMPNVKENNNLRDFYFRDIMLGEQDEELYE